MPVGLSAKIAPVDVRRPQAGRRIVAVDEALAERDGLAGPVPRPHVGQPTSAIVSVQAQRTIGVPSLDQLARGVEHGQPYAGVQTLEAPSSVEEVVHVPGGPAAEGIRHGEGIPLDVVVGDRPVPVGAGDGPFRRTWATARPSASSVVLEGVFQCPR